MPQLRLSGQPSVRNISHVCMALPDIAPESGVIEFQDVLRLCLPGRDGAGALLSYLFLLALIMPVTEHILDLFPAMVGITMHRGQFRSAHCKEL